MNLKISWLYIENKQTKKRKKEPEYPAWGEWVGYIMALLLQCSCFIVGILNKKSTVHKRHTNQMQCAELI